MAQRVVARAAQSGQAIHAAEVVVVVVGAVRSRRIVVGRHRRCLGSGAQAAPDGEGTTSRPEAGEAPGGTQGAVEAAAGGQARRLVA